MRTFRQEMLLAFAIFCLVTGRFADAGKPKAGDKGEYQLVILAPAVGEGSGSFPTDINDAGNVVGDFEQTSGNSRPFHYDPVTRTFVELEGPATTARAINAAGGIVGADFARGLAVYWSSKVASPEVLQPLSLFDYTQAFDINDDNVIVGWAIDENHVGRAVAWIAGGSGVSAPIELPPLFGDIHANVRRVSDFDNSGVATAVGYSGDDLRGVYEGEAVVWVLTLGSSGNLQTSPAIRLGTPSGSWSSGYAVNRFGDTCGTLERYPFGMLAGESMQLLDGPGKADFGEANDINAFGDVAGSFSFLRGNPTARYWDQRAYLWMNGKAIDLNTRVSLQNAEILETAVRINNSGDIIGTGYFPNSLSGGFLLLRK